MKINCAFLLFFFLSTSVIAQNDDSVDPIQLLQDSLAIKKKEFAADDVRLGFAYFDLAFASFQDLNPKEITQESYLKAIEIFEKQDVLPVELGLAYLNLGAWYIDADELKNGEAILHKGRMFFEQNYPENQKDLAEIFKNLGAIEIRKDDDPAALSYFEKALGIFVGIYGKGAIENNEILQNIGIVKYNLKAYEESESINFAILKNAQNHFGEKSTEVASIYESIGNMYSNMPGKQYDKALKYLKKGLAIYQELSPVLTPPMAVNHLFQGELYARKKEPEKASAYLSKSREIMLQYVGEKHLFIAASYYYEAYAFGESKAAEAAYLKALDCLDYDPENLDKLSSFTKGADLHFNFGTMYSLWYEDTDNEAYLWKAKEKYDTALKLMDMARNDFKEPANSAVFLGRYRRSFENMFVNYQLLAEKTGDSKHSEDLFFLDG